ncbi:MAG: hypothetical protein ACRDQU_06395 [Pseudonocardiaceae bacterium]
MAESWVGGDIAGLHTMAVTTVAAPAAMRDVVHALSARVDDLVGAAGWSGGAAEAFQKRWTADSISAGSLADVVGHVGGVLGDLATNLDKVNMALYNAEYEATKAGAPVGPDGTPGTIVSSDATPSGPAVTALQTYCDEYDAAMQLAKGFRLDAATKLSDIYDQISYQPGHQNNPDQWATLGDYVRGLYAVPDEKGRVTRGRLAGMDERIKRARQDLRAAKQEYAAKGLKLPDGNAAKAAHKGAFAEFRQLKADLETAESLERKLPLSAELNTKLSDIGKAIPEIGKITSKLPDFLKEVPVVDVLATGVAVGFQVKDDMEKARLCIRASTSTGAKTSTRTEWSWALGREWGTWASTPVRRSSTSARASVALPAAPGTRCSADEQEPAPETATGDRERSRGWHGYRGPRGRVGARDVSTE